MAGLAVRAGKAVFGTAACEKGIKKRTIKLLLLQKGLSDSSVNHFFMLCKTADVNMLMVDEDERLGDAVGRPEIMVLGITDKRFAEQIKYNIVGGSGI